MHGHEMPQNVLIVCGLMKVVIGSLALLEAMGVVTILGAFGLPWIYLMLILMGIGKLKHGFLCKKK